MKVNSDNSPALPILCSTDQEKCGGQDELLVARFRDGECALSVEQEQHVASWLVGKPVVGSKVGLILGGANQSSRAGRLRRLRGMLLVLGRLGVAARRIWPDIEWIKPARMGALEDMPADTVWLRLAVHHKAHR